MIHVPSLRLFRSLTLAVSIGAGCAFPAIAQQPTSVVRPVRTLQTEPRAVQLLDMATARLQRAQSLQATTLTEEFGPKDTVAIAQHVDTMQMTRPGSLDLRTNAIYPKTGSSSRYRYAVTPSTCLFGNLALGPQKTLAVDACDPATLLTRQESEIDVTVRGFFARVEGRRLSEGEWDAARLAHPLTRSVTYAGQQRWQGASYDVVRLEYEQTYTPPEDSVVYTTLVFIGRDSLVRRVLTMTSNGYRIDHQVHALTLDAPINEQVFAWTLPADAHVTPLLPSTVGQRYPDLPDSARVLGRGKATWANLAGKKATVLWFWNTRCGPCMVEFPFFERLYRTMKGRGVEVVAVNGWASYDSTELGRVRRMQAYNQTTQPILLGALDWSRLLDKTVVAVLDATGTIVYDRGYDMAAILQAIDRL